MTPPKVRATYFFSKPPKQVSSRVADGQPATAANTVQESLQGVANTVASTFQAGVELVTENAQKVLSNGQGTTTTSSAPVKIDPTFDREWYVDSVVNR
jgi:hypothetical protein